MYLQSYKLSFSKIFLKLKLLIVLFSKDALRWSKVTAKTFIILQKKLFQIRFVWNVYSSNNPEKKLQFPQNYYSPKLVPDDNNKKCFLSSKSAY